MRSSNSTDIGFYRISITLYDLYENSKIYEILVEILDVRGKSAFDYIEPDLEPD